MIEHQIHEIADRIHQADAVLVGAGSGLSSAAGYNHYHNDEMFQKNFGDFEDAYGIQNLFQGFYYLYSKSVVARCSFMFLSIKTLFTAASGKTSGRTIRILYGSFITKSC